MKTLILIFLFCITSCSYYGIYPAYYKKKCIAEHLLYEEDDEPVLLEILLSDTIYKPDCDAYVKIVLTNRSMNTIKIFPYNIFYKPYFFNNNKLIKIESTEKCLSAISYIDSVPILIEPNEKYDTLILLDRFFEYDFKLWKFKQNQFIEKYNKYYEYEYFEYPIGEYELFIKFYGYGHAKVSNIVRFRKVE